MSRSACTTLPHCHPHPGCRPAVATDQETEAQAVERLALGRRAAGPQSEPAATSRCHPLPLSRESSATSGIPQGARCAANSSDPAPAF